MSGDARISGSSAAAETSLARFADDVQYYLTIQPRQLPSRYFYDALGSALFEAICHLPWYTITRAELALLGDRAGAIFSAIDPLTTIIELGSGSGEKLATLVGAGRGRGLPLDVHLVDVSAAALATSSRTLAALGDVRIVTHQATYEAGLEEIAGEPMAPGRALVLLLGSNIGNFDPPGADAFLRAIRASLAGCDGLLLGADLVKPEAELLAAYDDPLGVTAAFNRNLLLRINRELGGDFDLDGFDHRAVWNELLSRVEMHLVSRRPQRVRVRAAQLDFELAAGESIWTESSYKYRPEGIVRMLERAGFRLAAQWMDREHGFALTLATSSPPLPL